MVLEKTKTLRKKLVTTRLENGGITGIRVEFTAPRTPQQNGKVERGFSALYNHVRSMLSQAKLEQQMKQTVWDECCNTATILDNLTVKKGSPSSSYNMV